MLFLASPKPLERGAKNPKFDDNYTKNALFFLIFLRFSRATGERHENATCKEAGLKPDFAREVDVEGKAATMQKSRRGSDFAREFYDVV